MEILQTKGKRVKDRIYLDDYYSEHVAEFRQLKGRYYKKKNQWVFSKGTIDAMIESDSTQKIERQCSAHTNIITKLFDRDTLTKEVGTQTGELTYEHLPPEEFVTMFREYIDLFQS